MAEKIEYEKYIVPAAIVVGGYFILKQFGLFGGGAAAANQSNVTSAAAAGTAAAINADKAAGGFATINAAQAAGIANQIFNAGTDPVDQDTIVRGVIQANTMQDLLLIIQAFGTKQAGGAMCSIFGGFLSATCGTYDLPSWLRANLDAAHLQSINGYLADQGINYQF
jgi:hypothetical protein